MGCAQSRIDNEESVARCKERRQWMKSAVSSRNAFAAAHSAYAVSLKNTGAALAEFAQGEAHPINSSSATGGEAAGNPSSAVGNPSSAAVVHPPPIDSLPPPPPPLPDFSPSPKIQRSISMPDLPPTVFPSKSIPPPSNASIREEEEEGEEEAEENHLDDRRRRRRRRPEAPSLPTPPPPPMPDSKSMDTWDYFFSMDETIAGPSLSAEEIRPERDELDEENVTRSPPPPPPVANGGEGDSDEPKTPENAGLGHLHPLPPKPPGRKQKQDSGVVHHQHAASAPPMDVKRSKMVAAEAPSVNLSQVLTDLDEHFLKASESSHEVLKMLEANRMHYHSNFADNRGHIDHSARVMKVITWNKSFKGIPNCDDGKDDFDNDEWETLATVLDKMLAWEKKLYDEVKAGELMKIEYQRKVTLLNKQKRSGASTEALEKTKAAVSHLHTRYIVDMQSMDSTVSEIQHLRDNQLYPRLMELVDGMAKMWETMYLHHEGQLKIVLNLKALDMSNSSIETSQHHHSRTIQLCNIVNEWQLQFLKLIGHQREYMQALNSWLKLNLIPIESSLKEKVSSPPRTQQPPIQGLLLAWHDHLAKLPDELAKSAIVSFSAVLKSILALQQDEMKQKEKCEEAQKEYMRRSRAFEDWYQKYSQRKAASSEAELEVSEGTNQKDPVTERKFMVESLKSRLDDEVETHNNLCKQVREKSLTSLKTHLPELFRALSDFSQACSDMYSKLKLVSMAREPVAN
ncbi:protein ALTERED PHOSPHATE STARVATION RESPONSE 1 [Typha latifolia]|uniref:protein ALTERED PHOSPHATE STARVATION RESPONSE 1 n=1 Tax=Typha latifolia TaxID=4733 RepID=UPI003C2DC384